MIPKDEITASKRASAYGSRSASPTSYSMSRRARLAIAFERAPAGVRFPRLTLSGRQEYDALRQGVLGYDVAATREVRETVRQFVMAVLKPK